MESETALFQKALTSFVIDNFSSALKIFKDLIKQFPDKASYLLYAANCENHLKQYDKAYDDACAADKLSPNSFEILFQKGISAFYLNKCVESKMAFTSALQLAKDPERKNKVTPWSNKVDIELNENGIYDFNREVKQGIKVLTDWMQTPTTVTVELTGNQNMNQFNVEIKQRELVFIGKEKQEVRHIIQLTNNVIPEKSSYRISGMKIHLDLAKEVPNFNWVNLEVSTESDSNAKKGKQVGMGGYYPSSSKVKKDWSQFDKEFDAEMKESAKNDGNEGMWSMFRQIYERSDENTRRAMIKSFQTSNGTVLSTNWNEVKDKDYEGKDRPEAPKGQEWRKDTP